LFKNQWGMDKLNLRDSLLSVRDSLSYSLLCKIIFIQWGGEGKDVKMLFDKNPVYYYFLPTLEMIFPEASFIHIVRDYRANIKKICEFFKISFSENLAKDHTSYIYSTFNENKKDRFREMHRSLFTPINIAHVDEWRKKLSQDEIMEAEAIAGVYGKTKYDYPIVSTKPIKINLLRMGVIKIRYLVIRITYSVVFSDLSLYYFIRRKVWKDF
jgi:hypothetical protein